MEFPAMNMTASNIGFPSLGIEGGEFLGDDLFPGLARGIDFER